MSIINNNRNKNNKKTIYTCDYCSKKGHLENFCIKKKNDILNDLSFDLHNINIDDTNQDDDNDDNSNIIVNEKIIYNNEVIEFSDEYIENNNIEERELHKYFKTLDTMYDLNDDNNNNDDVSDDVEKKCKFCEDYNKNMGTHHDIYHYTKHPIDNTIVLCPLLANNVCNYCKIKGHTPRFCPKSFNDNFFKNSYSQFLKNKNNDTELEFIFRF
jgi:hypothetical protein